MKNEQLEIFLTIVETKSISAASRRLYLSQSAVSSVLSQLEKELGTILIERSRGQRSSLQPSKDGQLLYEYARRVLFEYEQLRIQIREHQTLSAETFRPIQLIAGQTLSIGIVPIILGALKKKLPAFQVSLKVCPTGNITAIKRLFREEDADFILGIAPLDDQRYISEQIIRDPIVLICNCNLNISSPISVKELKKLPLIFREADSGTMRFLENALCSHPDFPTLDEFHPVMIQHGATAVREAVKNGAFCGFVPLSLVNPTDRLIYYNIVQVTGLESKRAIYLHRKKSQVLSPEMSMLRRFILGSEWHAPPFT